MNKIPKSIEDAEDEGENGNPFSGNDERMKDAHRHDREYRRGMEECRKSQNNGAGHSRYGSSHEYSQY